MAAELVDLLKNPPSEEKDKDVQTTKGSCLCGSIQYTITGPPSATGLCHCFSCKKTSGSSFMANSFYRTSQFQITSPQTTLKMYRDVNPTTGDSTERSFCGKCGSPLFVQSPKSESTLAVTSGTQDLGEEGARDWKPVMEFFCKRRGRWLGEVGAERERRFEEV